MCIIIDACCANFLENAHLPQGRLVLDWIKAGGKVISGGKLEKELRGTKLQALLVQWKASGRLISADSEILPIQEAAIDRDAINSNDLHVLALAKASGARVVVTRDRTLMQDLKKSGQVAPAGKIYPFPEDQVQDLRVQRGVLRNAGCR
ncbi:MAG TPA: hypothetical protein VM913_03535 [Sphingomicrobium sp.]|jgi:hypothetical protein|nr:hypothetical protein [Sphingomicrobium sp.]